METGYTDTQPAVKRRAACDECRTKKLKCTGEQPACARCGREGLTCVYSPQKQMGRPKKRQRMAEEEGDYPAAGRGEQGLVGATTGFDTALTQNGSMQPWLQDGIGTGIEAHTSGHWDFGDAHQAPGLTPDDGSIDSPPILNLPPELQQTHHRDTSTQILLDPSLSSTGHNLGLPPTTLPSCACLSTMYLTLNNLQSMDPSFAFPFALHPLREAMQTATEVLSCEACPKTFISSVQNTQLVGTLLTSIAERFSRVLEGINDEYIRAETASESKKFRLADLNTSTSHLHTGGLGCAAAFSIDLSPEEWKSMAKKVVRAEVHGPSDGNNCCPYFLGVTRQMLDRQERWHSAHHPIPLDCPKDVHGAMLVGKNLPREQHTCFKMAQFAEALVSGFDWT